MKKLLYLLTISILAAINLVNAQTFNRTYQGYWATTIWTFEFKSDGTYKRISGGHYGNTTVAGNYKVNRDTIQLLTGFKETHGTVNEKYLIDKDSLIIDLRLYYDYKLPTGSRIYSSKKRYDILQKPNLDSSIVVSKQQFDTIVEHCTSLLKNRMTTELNDQDHIKIIRLINTLRMNQSSSYNINIYSDFMKLVQEKDYEKEISIYYDWTPNRGMGFYFQKLQIELGGTPHLYSRYRIK